MIAALNVYFILHYHLFFCKEIYFFEFLYFSEYDIRMSLYVFCLIKGPSASTYLHYFFSCFASIFVLQYLALFVEI